MVIIIDHMNLNNPSAMAIIGRQVQGALQVFYNKTDGKPSEGELMKQELQALGITVDGETDD